MTSPNFSPNVWSHTRAKVSSSSLVRALASHRTTFVQVAENPSLGLVYDRGWPKNANFFKLLLGDMYATVTMFFQVFATPWGRLVTYRRVET